MVVSLSRRIELSGGADKKSREKRKKIEIVNMTR